MFWIIFIILLNLLFTSLLVPLPFKDEGTVRYNTLPWMTFSLIVVNSFVFLFIQSGDYLKILEGDYYSDAVFQAQFNYLEKIYKYGFQISHLKNGASIGAFTTFTSTFMHADFNHLASNMIFLWAFGRRVEDACGAWRFFMFYMLAGISAAMGFAIFASAETDLPGIGASGAIFGVVGAYLLLFPGARLTCMWGLGVVFRVFTKILGTLFGFDTEFKWTIKLPAILVTLPYVAMNVMPTFRTVETGELDAGINYVAHMAGFLSAVTIFLFVRKDLMHRYFSGRSL